MDTQSQVVGDASELLRELARLSIDLQTLPGQVPLFREAKRWRTEYRRHSKDIGS